jgi:hypothetical protein
VNKLIDILIFFPLSLFLPPPLSLSLSLSIAQSSSSLVFSLSIGFAWRMGMVVTEKSTINVKSFDVNEALLPQSSPTGSDDTNTNFNGKYLSHHSIRNERSSKDLAAQ